MKAKKYIPIFSVFVLFLWFSLTGCSGGDDGGPEKGSDSSNSALSPFTSSEALERYLKDGLRLNAGATNLTDTVPSSGEDADAATGSGDSASGVSFSQTNLQEEGVDEGDIIKTDGRYLYVVPKDTKNNPQSLEESTTVSDGELGIRVLELASSPPSAVEVGVIPLQNQQNRVDDLYLHHGRGEGKPDLLITIGGQASDGWHNWFTPWFWLTGTTEVAFFNVNSPAAAEPVIRITLDGQLIASRRIGDTLYLVTRYTPNLPGYNTYPMTNEEQRANESILANATLGDLLPHWAVNGQTKGDLIGAEDCYLPPLDKYKKEQPTLITVTALDLNAPDNPVSRCVAGPTETVYVSMEALYLATTRFAYQIPVSLTESNGAGIEENLDGVPPETTDLHKFNLTENGTVYRGSGSVQGHLGWEKDKKPFRMSHYEGILRIATSLGDTWNLTATTRLTLLREEDPDATVSTLQEIAHIDGIGKAGERLYAVRFVGPRGYLVTFRVTDPLYILDLSDPENPAQLGELHIDGYSDYLHPIGDNFLLGIGKDAVPDSTSDDLGGRGAWYQGVKLVLFDISDLANPREVAAQVIGKRGTESDVLYDHHAFGFLPPVNDGEAARLALPIRLHDTPSGSDPSQPWYRYYWTHTGLYLFDIFTDGRPDQEASIEERGRIIVEQRSETNTDFWYWNDSKDRAVLLEDSVHYIHDGQVWSAAWDATTETIGPQ
jgi:uncharacterized secreted protein with C-terminal beta-propeller domain